MAPTYMCSRHLPPSSDLLLPTHPPYEGRADRSREYQNWWHWQQLFKEHDKAVRKLCCARTELGNILNPFSPPPCNPRKNMKEIIEMIAQLEENVIACREEIKTAEADGNYWVNMPLSEFRHVEFIMEISYGMGGWGRWGRTCVTDDQILWRWTEPPVRNGCRLPFRQTSTKKRRRRSNKTRRRRVMVLPGLVNGLQVAALPDTGAGRNMMSERYARSHNIQIHKGLSNQSTYRLANGRSVKSKGRAYVQWSFEKEESRVYDLEFQILPDCVYDVIIGQDFLTETDTLCANRQRLRIQMSTPRDVRYVNLCGAPSQSLLGFINGEPIRALPDTGSEVNIMSEAYAESHGYKINRADEDEMDMLQFADGTSQKPLGKVSAKWAFNDDPGGAIEITFEVLARCPYEVIIGLDVLHEHDVYNKHRSCLVERVTGTDKAIPLNHVGWRASFVERLKRKKAQSTTVTQSQAELRRIDDELVRRAEAVRMIERIEDSGRRRAEYEKEELIRRSWDDNLSRVVS